MKQLLFLLLFPCLALAQYQGNAGQKITLGEQTTADGLVWRGRTSDTSNLMTNKIDTSAYLVLDTMTEAIWLYRASTTPKWNRVVDSLNNLQGQLSLTTKVTGVLPVANGGTGQNTLALNKVMVGNGTSGVLTPTDLHWDNSTAFLGVGEPNPTLFKFTVKGSIPALFNSTDTRNDITFGGTRYYRNVSTNGAGNGFQMAFNDNLNNIAEYCYIGGYIIDNTSTSRDGGILFMTTNNNVNRQEVMRLINNGNVGIGTTAPVYKLDVTGTVRTSTGSAISYAAGENYIIWNDNPEYSVVDDTTDSNYKTMKTFVASKSGTFKFKFSGYIQSGNNYWAWRVLKNGATVVSSGRFNSGLDVGETNSVHAYRRFVGTVSDIEAGDSFELQMVSSTIAGAPVAGNGQILYAKEFRIYSTTPSVEHGGLANIWGGNVGIGTTNPTAKLYVNNSTVSTESFRVDGVSGGGMIVATNGTTFPNSSLGLMGGNVHITSTNVGIGQTTPTSVLHLKAGTATASTAPLKFTSGTNLTTAEAGAMEFNGTNLFFSPSTTRHTVNHGLTGSATLNFPSTTTLLSADLTITVTGAADGDVVSLGVPNAAVNANTSYSAWVSAANTVTVRFNNYSSGTVDPASGLFKVFVTK